MPSFVVDLWFLLLSRFAMRLPSVGHANGSLMHVFYKHAHIFGEFFIFGSFFQARLVVFWPALCVFTHSEWLTQNFITPFHESLICAQRVKKRIKHFRAPHHILIRILTAFERNNPNCCDINVAEEGPSLSSLHKCHLFINSISSTSADDFYGYSCAVTVAPCYF